MLRSIAIAVGVILISQVPVRADVPGPGPRPRPPVKQDYDVPLVLEMSETIDKPELHVPKSMVNKWRQAALPTDSEYRAASTGLPTILAGLALAVSFGFGGVWLARKRGLIRPSPLVLLIASLAIAGFTAMHAFARPPQPVNNAPKGPAIKVVVESKGDAIKLVLPKADVEKLTEKKK